MLASYDPARPRWAAASEPHPGMSNRADGTAVSSLGREQGERFAAQRATAGVLLRLPAQQARAWDLAAILPR
jgi:hypothetical protein